MSKIVCDICGTTYSETEAQCPICGCSKDTSAAALAEELLEEEVAAVAAAGTVAAAVEKAPVFEEDAPDYDDDDYDDDDDEDDDDEDEEDEEDEHKSNAGLVILLVIVILLLLAVGAFILVKYFLPNVVAPETTAPAVVETTEAPADTTELKIPCESLALTSGGEIVLENEGANWLINVMALPENTTDELIYTSSDETVVTVNEQGKLTAVGEGTAVITITCGEQELKCTVTCDFTEETTAPTEPEETEPSEPEETTEPTEETEPTEPLKDINLEKAISHTDLTFNAKGQGFTFKITGLKNTEVMWTSEDESIVTVDENGFVISVGKGTTYIICKYGDQEVKVKITCRW